MNRWTNVDRELKMSAGDTDWGAWYGNQDKRQYNGRDIDIIVETKTSLQLTAH